MNLQKHILIFVVCSFFFLPMAVSAASISIQATPTRVGVGDVVRVDVLIDSAIPVNAFSGAVLYSTSTLEPIAVSDGNSIISLWVNHPALPATPGAEIAFAGITPGGFSGDSGTLFSVLFRATAVGRAEVSLRTVDVLRNDGVGGREPVTMTPLALLIASTPSGGYAEPGDQTPPESFTVHLGNDSSLFDGRSYLVFVAVDKNSGIDHYRIAESRVPAFLVPFLPLSWHTATTTVYVVADQNLTSTVYVKAVDRAGNERVSVFPPQHLFTPYEKAVLLGILILVVLFWKSGWGRRFRKNL